MMRHNPFLLLLPMLLWAACSSADELYNRGQQLETEGRFEEAVAHYIDTLEKQPSLRKAQGRLRVAGNHLFNRYVAAAATASPPDAADQVLAAGALRDRIASVGVALQVPPSFASDQAQALDQAVAFLLAVGIDDLEAELFDQALGQFDRARRYRPSAEQEAVLDSRSYDALLAAADADLASGRYRAAFARAEEARRFAVATGPIARIDGFQAALLDRASIYTAIFPLEGAGGRTSGLTDSFMRELDDLLNDEYWSRPPLFVRVIDPTDVRRLLRRYDDADDRFDDPRLTGALARDLRAGFGVAVAVRNVRRSERALEQDTLSAPLRDGSGAGRYVRTRSQLTLEGVIEYMVVRASTADIVCAGTVEADESARITRAEHLRAGGRGPVRALDLSRNEQALFDEDEWERAERDLEFMVQESLAEKLTVRVFDCLQTLVP